MPQNPAFLREKRRIAARMRRLERDIASHVSRFLRDHSRVTADGMRDLIRRVETDATIHIRAATRGRNAEFIAARMRAHAIDARLDVPRFLRAAATANVTNARLRRDVGRLIRGALPGLGSYGLRPKDVGGLKSLSTDARRLLITEGFIAARETTLDGLDPGRRYAWELSPLHKEVDDCDDLAAAGPYFPWEWPDAPHPNCGCGPGEAELLSRAEMSRVRRGIMFDDDDEPDVPRGNITDYLATWQRYLTGRRVMERLSARERTVLANVEFDETDLQSSGLNGLFTRRSEVTHSSWLGSPDAPTRHAETVTTPARVAIHNKLDPDHAFETAAHEIGHAFDDAMGMPSLAQQFAKAIAKDGNDAFALADDLQNDRRLYLNHLNRLYVSRSINVEIWADLFAAARLGVDVRHIYNGRTFLRLFPNATKMVRREIRKLQKTWTPPTASFKKNDVVQNRAGLKGVVDSVSGLEVRVMWENGFTDVVPFDTIRKVR